MSHECPTCGEDDFETEKAMKIHHSRSHGERLVDTRTCPVCDEEFVDERRGREQTFCSTECYHESQRDRAEVDCLGCEETFEVPVGDADDRKYCSVECRKKSNRTKNTCAECGDEFWVYRRRAHERKYCSDSCKGRGIRVDSDSRIRKECDACGSYYRTYRDDAQFCCLVCHWESNREDDRPDDVDDLLVELYTEENHALWETWKRSSVALEDDDQLTKKEVRQRLIELDEFSHAHQKRNTIEQMDPDELGEATPEGDDSWKELYSTS